MNVYKCRAECELDVQEVSKFLNSKCPEGWFNVLVEKTTLDVDGQLIPIPDVDWTFQSSLSHEELTNLLLTAPPNDWHVLIESLKPVDQYDGERDNKYS